MKETLERPRAERPKVSPNFSRKTLTWVGGAHLLVLILLGLTPFLFTQKPKEKLLVMVPLGSDNPGQGSPAGSNQGSSAGGNPTPQKNSNGAPPPPLPPPPKVPPKQPVKAVKEPEPVKEEAKMEPEPVKTPPKVEKVEPKVEKIEPKVTKVVPEIKKVEPKVVPQPKADVPPKEEAKKPVKTPVKVEIGPLVKRTVPGTVAKKTNDSGEESGKEGGVEGGAKDGVKGGVKGSTGDDPQAKGPSASDIKNQIGKGLTAAGIEGGKGAGAQGAPDGSAYNALIKKTLTGNWTKPSNSGIGLKTKVKIRVKPDGTVELVGIFLPSGDSAMDQSILEAVRSTGKLDKPLPEGLGSPDYEVVVNFQLD